MAVEAVLWPLRVVDGDWKTGDRSTAIRADIRVVVKTRKFVDINIAGERLMRPSAFSRMPFRLIAAFDPFTIGPVSESFLREALAWLERSKKIELLAIRSVTITGGIRMRALYEVRETGEQFTYEYELPTSAPDTSQGVGGTI